MASHNEDVYNATTADCKAQQIVAQSTRIRMLVEESAVSAVAL